jgi:hypothetical protein
VQEDQPPEFAERQFLELIPPVVMYCILFYLFAVGLDNRQKAVSGERQIDLA